MNKMNNKITDITERQILRGRILELCRDVIPMGASIEMITAALKKEGYIINKQDVITASNYLANKGLLQIDNVKNEVFKIYRNIAHITQGVRRACYTLWAATSVTQALDNRPFFRCDD